ncbi:hypothetical protein [Brachybacterium nesterenkovii]|uniref:hypothetical protein n=1 Tax=Brachybacterium nesterenkovii TaxID=47847 RepID=UPI003219F5DB
MAPERIVLDLPGGPLALEGTPALAALMDELRELWAPVVVEQSAVSADGAARRTPATGHRGAAPRSGTAPEGDEEDGPRVLRLVAREEDAASLGARAVDPGPGAAYAVSGLVTREVIGALIGHRLLLHAAAVATPQLGCVLLVGPSGAGKSTAARTLGRGGTYLTDELTVIDPETFAVTAYPKPVSVAGEPDPDGGEASKTDVALPELGLVAGAGAARPDAVVLLDRVEERGADASSRRLPLAEALPQLIAQSSSVWRVLRPLTRLATLLGDVGGALELRYVEAEDMHALLADPPPALREPWEAVAPRSERPAEPPTVDAEASPARSDTEPVPGGAEPTPAPSARRAHADGTDPDGPDPAGAGPCWQAASFVEALVVEQGVLVLRQGDLITLGGGAALVWLDLASQGPAAARTIAARLDLDGPRPAFEDVEECMGLLAELHLIARCDPGPSAWRERHPAAR